MSPAVLPLLEEAPPLNDRGKVSLVTNRRGARVILEPDEEVVTRDGKSRITRKGRVIKFEQGRAEVDLETWPLLAEHPMFSGEGQPKEIWLEHENSVVAEQGGVQVVDGAVHASQGARAKPPLPEWDRMTPTLMRRQVAAGKVTDPIEAIFYEKRHRNRSWVHTLLGAQLAGAELPHANALTAQARREGGEPEAEAEAPRAPQPGEHKPDDDEVAAVREALAAATGDDGDIDPAASEPIPPEGVM